MKRIRVRSRKYYKYALVDDLDFDWLKGLNWKLVSGYAALRFSSGKLCYMHHLVQLVKTMPRGRGLVTDHINRNRLDNRSTNLRTITQSENCLNRN